MKLPIQVVFRDISHSDAIEAAVLEKADKLDRFFEHIMSCRVTIGTIQRHQHQGKLFNVRIDMTVPGSEIVVNRDQREDVYVAIQEAFGAAKRKLEDYVRRLRGDIKVHEAETHGRIARLFAEEGYGFIEKADGGDVYFHLDNCVHPSFDKLKIGDPVAFLEEIGAEGPQANRVKLRKHPEA